MRIGFKIKSILLVEAVRQKAKTCILFLKASLPLAERWTKKATNRPHSRGTFYETEGLFYCAVLFAFKFSLLVSLESK